MSDYTRCACCGQALDVMQQVMPRRTLTLVTCKNPACHPQVRWQTLTPDEHGVLCQRLAQDCRNQAVQA